MGTPTTAYVTFCMRKVAMLQHFGVVPVLVFDGARLPAKAGTEQERQRKRAEAKSKGTALLRAGQRSEALALFSKAVDVTPRMAKEVLDACAAAGVEAVVAPYEADAQLAYMVISGQCEAVLTEDSDLVVFGCPRILFKLEDSGRVDELQLEYIRADLSPSMVNVATWSFARIRQMFIMSGCDYLPSIKGFGVSKAWQFLRDFQSAQAAIKMIRAQGKHTVPRGYEQAFEEAENTFLYQPVWCAARGEMIPLNPYPPDLGPEAVASYAGAILPPDLAREVCEGRVDPCTHLPFDVAEGGKPAPAPVVWRQYVPGKNGLPPPESQANKMDRYVTVKVKPASRVEAEPEAAASAPGPPATERFAGLKRPTKDAAPIVRSPFFEPIVEDQGADRGGSAELGPAARRPRLGSRPSPVDLTRFARATPPAARSTKVPVVGGAPPPPFGTGELATRFGFRGEPTSPSKRSREEA